MVPNLTTHYVFGDTSKKLNNKTPKKRYLFTPNLASKVPVPLECLHSNVFPPQGKTQDTPEGLCPLVILGTPQDSSHKNWEKKVWASTKHDLRWKMDYFWQYRNTIVDQ